MHSNFFGKNSKPENESESEFKEKKTDDSDSTIDLSTDPTFTEIVRSNEKEAREGSEVPIQLIRNYLKDFDDINKAKKADLILKELEGLMNTTSYKENDRVIRAVRDSIKKYGSPNVVKYIDTIHALSIRPKDAKILPDLFEDFENAFHSIPPEEEKDLSRNQIKNKP
jgi:hypothetical protein